MIEFLPGDFAVSEEYDTDSSFEIKRVTHILDEINSPGIIQWANSLGFKHLSYNKELNKYAALGTKVHNEIENVIKSGMALIDAESLTTAGSCAFVSWLENRINNGDRLRTLEVEKSIKGKYFRGTMDCIMQINGETYLIDFKTSNSIGYKYFMQLCAYRYLLMLSGYPYNIDKMMILQVSKTDPDKYREYIIDCHIDTERVEETTKAFLDLVQLSYLLDKVRNYSIE